MSFILDALKKSENERQQQAEAEFASVPSGSDTPRAPRWLWILGALLVLNIAVLLGILLRPGAPAPPGDAPRRDVPVQNAQQAVADAPVSEARDSFTERVAEARRNQPQAEPVARDVSNVAAEPAASAPVATTSASTSEFASLPTLTEVRANNQLQLPDLHVDVHVYSPVPRERFVFINMSKYRENEVIREGPRITRIEADGVVFEYQGVSFVLPRD